MMSRMPAIRVSSVMKLFVLLASLLLATKCASGQDPFTAAGGPAPSLAGVENSTAIETSTEHTNLMNFTSYNVTDSSLITSETIAISSTLSDVGSTPITNATLINTTKSNVTGTSDEKTTTPPILTTIETTTVASSQIIQQVTTTSTPAEIRITPRSSTTAAGTTATTQGNLTATLENNTTMSSVNSTENSEFESTSSNNTSEGSSGQSVRASAATACGILLALVASAVA